MPLTTELLRTYFGHAQPPGSVQIALARDGVELSTDGYRRASVSRGRWKIVGEVATASVRHGPFPAGAAFDESWLMVGGQVQDVARFDAEIRLLQGMAFEHDYSFRFDG